MIVMLAGVFLALGCSGGDGDTNPLIGTWALELTSSCAIGVKFEETSFENILFCLLEDGSLGVESYLADYTYSGDTITYTDTHSSCPDGDTEETIRYSFVGGNLRLVHPSGIVVLEPINTDMTSGVVATYGCFEEGVFTPRDIQPL